MRGLSIAAIICGLTMGAGTIHPSVAQSTTTATTQSATQTSPGAAAEAAPTAKVLEGAKAFTKDDEELGKVIKANAGADGRVTTLEIQSDGYWGFFKKSYVVPMDKAMLKFGRVELTMTNDEAEALAK